MSPCSRLPSIPARLRTIRPSGCRRSAPPSRRGPRSRWSGLADPSDLPKAPRRGHSSFSETRQLPGERENGRPPCPVRRTLPAGWRDAVAAPGSAAPEKIAPVAARPGGECVARPARAWPASRCARLAGCRRGGLSPGKCASRRPDSGHQPLARKRFRLETPPPDQRREGSLRPLASG